MKKFLLSISAVVLIGTAWAIGEKAANEFLTENTDNAYGFLIADDNGRKVGLYTFPKDDCSAPTLIAESEDVSAGAMAGNTYYAMTYNSGSPATAKAWNSVDINTGAFTKIADCTEGSPLYTDLTYDYSHSRLLGIYHYGGNSTVVATVDPSTGAATTYADLPNMWMITLSASYDGDIYMIGRSNVLAYHLINSTMAANSTRLAK